MAKRDFVFLDESGEPGLETPYYISGLIHVTDESLKAINLDLGAFRYFGKVRSELKSTRLNPLQKEHLLALLRKALADNRFVKASVAYVHKQQYQGPFLWPEHGSVPDPTRFRHLIMRRHLTWHFRQHPPQSKEVELVIDRFHSDEAKEQQLRHYLHKDEKKELPDFLNIIQADSRYVELLQVADWISGSVKEAVFTHPEREAVDLLSHVDVVEIKK